MLWVAKKGLLKIKFSEEDEIDHGKFIYHDD